MQITVENWPGLLLTLLWMGGPLLGAALVMLSARTGDGYTPVDREEYQRHRRQLQGGRAFNEYLWDMQGDEERRTQRFLSRMSTPDVSDEDRRLYAEEINTSRRQLDRIYRMLMMEDR